MPPPADLMIRRATEADLDAINAIYNTTSGGAVIGFTYLSTYRGRRGYQYTRENTIMVDTPYQRAGIGRLLLARVIEAGRALGLRSIVAWITSTNAGSIELHRQFGYTVIGEEIETGRKFGEWHSAFEMQLLLDRPDVP